MRAIELVEHALHRLESVQPRCNVATHIFADRARALAARLDDALARGTIDPAKLPLAGVPVAIKDNIVLGPDLCHAGDGLGLGGPTTCASAMLREYHSPFTATSAQRLLDAGAIPIAKANMDEFGFGSSTERSIFGPTRNPHDPSRIAGGSSGGSAAIVASGCVPIALGSDTGGSVRQPAALCGVVGLKPTYGRVSRWGLVAFASSLDQVGPITHDVRDAALCLRVIAGHDPLDATSADRPDAGDELLTDLDVPITRPRIAVPRQARGSANDPRVGAAFEHALQRFASAGGEVVEVDLPLLDAGVAAYYIIALAEASSNLARFDGVRYGHRASLREGATLADLYRMSRSEGLGEEAQRRIMLGTHVLSAGYYDAYVDKAMRLREALRRQVQREVFERLGCHALATPTTPQPACPLGELTTDPLRMYLGDVYTVTANLTGLPALSVPMGTVPSDVAGGPALPVGLQLLGRPFEEGTLLRLGRMAEQSRSS